MPPTRSLMVPRNIINALLFECIIYMNYTIKKQPPEAKSAIQKIVFHHASLLVLLQWVAVFPASVWYRKAAYHGCLVCFSKGLCAQWSSVTGPRGGTSFEYIGLEEVSVGILHRTLKVEKCNFSLHLWDFETMSSFLINNNRNVIEVTQQPDNVCKYCWITGRA